MFGDQKLDYVAENLRDYNRTRISRDVDKAWKKYEELKAKGASSAELELAMTVVNDHVRDYWAQ